MIRSYIGGPNLDQEFSESIPERVTYKLNFKIMTEGGQARSKLVLQAEAGWGPSEKLIRDGKKAGTERKRRGHEVRRGYTDHSGLHMNLEFPPH